MTGSEARCFDLTRAPRGYLRCVKPLGHPELLHQVDPAGPVISRETVHWVDGQLADLEKLLDLLEKTKHENTTENEQGRDMSEDTFDDVAEMRAAIDEVQGRVRPVESAAELVDEGAGTGVWQEVRGHGDHVDGLTEVADKQVELENARIRVTTLEEENRRLERDLALEKDAHRETANRKVAADRAADDRIEEIIAAAHEEADNREWCEDFDEWMEQMGLRGRSKNYQVIFSVNVRVSVEVEARSRDSAEEMVSGDNLAARMNEISWNEEDLSSFEVIDVELAEQ